MTNRNNPLPGHGSTHASDWPYRDYSRPSINGNPEEVDAVVVGGGPAGIAVVGKLLETLPKTQRQLWVDPFFNSGRIGDKYREVPSNTKVKLFWQYATAVEPFRHIADVADVPNGIRALNQLPHDEGCELSHAADMCLTLTEGLWRHYADQIRQHKGKAEGAVLDMNSKLWTVALDDGEVVRTPRVVLCTGCDPVTTPLPIMKQKPHLFEKGPGIKFIHMDTAVKPSLLVQTLDRAAPTTVAVVGGSHSAVLVLMNLYNLATSTHPNLRIKWFTRSKKLLYAKEVEDGIIHDNTGLKGQAAQWARANLEEDTFPSSPVRQVVKKIWTQPEEGREDDIQEAELPGCTHIVEAIGFQRNPLPVLSVVESQGSAPRPLDLEFDDTSGRFFEKSSQQSPEERRYLPGVFGSGIAFPERAKDPVGNEEHAVGLIKFSLFAQRVVPEWVRSP